MEGKHARMGRNFARLGRNDAHSMVAAAEYGEESRAVHHTEAGPTGLRRLRMPLSRVIRTTRSDPGAEESRASVALIVRSGC